MRRKKGYQELILKTRVRLNRKTRTGEQRAEFSPSTIICHHSTPSVFMRTESDLFIAVRNLGKARETVMLRSLTRKTPQGYENCMEITRFSGKRIVV
jgi:hypothetical protein